ncbi:autotransporter domain-containing protein [Mesorhizobium sp. B4-1-4]|uniref:autotransporter outer membrane beta-barrel domain-containing protein n=1 Tax=Mesorhizobium sp. B4-1-4 TaxID=2589888 RepID=UPI0011273D5E|nr:autotransporter domain-containing protein [Mesorhizobium sp. B4-1-4]TPK81709.1 autotransporter domain-containing protein [Mesorhizobium sp. B2-4-17]
MCNDSARNRGRQFRRGFRRSGGRQRRAWLQVRQFRRRPRLAGRSRHADGLRAWRRRGILLGAGRETSGNIIGGHAGAYGAHKWDQFYINGSLAMDLYSNTTDRFTSVPGASGPLNPVPAITREHWTGDFMSAGFGTSLEAGWRQPIGAGALTPFAGLQFQALSMQAFSEKSASDGALGLDFDSRTVISLPVSLGLQLDTTVAVGGTTTLQAWGRAAWQHEFKPDRSVEPHLPGSAGLCLRRPGR